MSPAAPRWPWRASRISSTACRHARSSGRETLPDGAAQNHHQQGIGCANAPPGAVPLWTQENHEELHPEGNEQQQRPTSRRTPSDRIQIPDRLAPFVQVGREWLREIARSGVVRLPQEPPEPGHPEGQRRDRHQAAAHRPQRFTPISEVLRETNDPGQEIRFAPHARNAQHAGRGPAATLLGQRDPTGNQQQTGAIHQGLADA